MDVDCDNDRRRSRATALRARWERGVPSQVDLLPVKSHFGSRPTHRFILGRTFNQHGFGVVDVDVDEPFDADCFERNQRAVSAADRHMTHAPAGLRTGTGAGHLIISPYRSVEEYNARLLKECRNFVGDLSRGGHIKEGSPTRSHCYADGRVGPRIGYDAFGFEIQWYLAGHREQLDLDPSTQPLPFSRFGDLPLDG